MPGVEDATGEEKEKQGGRREDSRHESGGLQPKRGTKLIPDSRPLICPNRAT